MVLLKTVGARGRVAAAAPGTQLKRTRCERSDMRERARERSNTLANKWFRRGRKTARDPYVSVLFFFFFLSYSYITDCC